MDQIQFHRAYESLVERTRQFQKNFDSMNIPQRAIEQIEINKQSNELFANRLKDTMLGNHIDILI
jgi:hypothetical protein